MAKAPAFLQKYGSRILLGVLVCISAGVWGYKYFADKEDEAKAAAGSVDEARTALVEMKTEEGSLSQAKDLQDFEKRLTAQVEGVEKHLTPDALKKSTDPKILAAAAILRGQANWEAANAPRPAATQPVAAPQPTPDYLQKAADAYAEVLKPPLSSDHGSLTAARFGLAYVAENRGQFDEAAKYYNLIINDSATDPSIITYAKERLGGKDAAGKAFGLEELKQHLFLSKSREPAPDATSKPAPVVPPPASSTPPVTPAVPVSPTTAPATPAVPSTTAPASPTSSATEVIPSTTGPAAPATQPALTTPTSAPAIASPPTTRPAQ